MRKFNEESNLSGGIIRKYRTEKGLSLEALANQLQLDGISIDKSHLSRLEKGDVIVKDFELIAIAKILEIDLKEFEDEYDTILKSSY